MRGLGGDGREIEEMTKRDVIRHVGMLWSGKLAKVHAWLLL